MNGGELSGNTAAYGGAIYVSGSYTAASGNAPEQYNYGYVTLTGEDDIKNMGKLIEALEDNDDVIEVYHNWENAD